MWEFLTTVYNGNGGGCGLFIAFWILCATIGKIGVAMFKRYKEPKEK